MDKIDELFERIHQEHKRVYDVSYDEIYDRSQITSTLNSPKYSNVILSIEDHNGYSKTISLSEVSEIEMYRIYLLSELKVPQALEMKFNKQLEVIASELRGIIRTELEHPSLTALEEIGEQIRKEVELVQDRAIEMKDEVVETLKGKHETRVFENVVGEQKQETQLEKMKEEYEAKGRAEQKQEDQHPSTVQKLERTLQQLSLKIEHIPSDIKETALNVEAKVDVAIVRNKIKNEKKTIRQSCSSWFGMC